MTWLLVRFIRALRIVVRSWAYYHQRKAIEQRARQRAAYFLTLKR